MDELDVRFLTVAEVAAIMRVSRMTVYRLVNAGDLPAVRVGKSYRVPQQAVDAFLRQGAVGRGPRGATGTTSDGDETTARGRAV